MGVLKTRAGALGLECLHNWAAELHVADLPEHALKQAS
jgi:hypothetical protein